VRISLKGTSSRITGRILLKREFLSSNVSSSSAVGKRQSFLPSRESFLAYSRASCQDISPADSYCHSRPVFGSVQVTRVCLPASDPFSVSFLARVGCSGSDFLEFACSNVISLCGICSLSYPFFIPAGNDNLTAPAKSLWSSNENFTCWPYTQPLVIEAQGPQPYPDQRRQRLILCIMTAIG
jgi:hypothetical protein